MSVKPDSRKLMERCIEDGISTGIIRAHRHTETPTRPELEQAITRAVLEEIDEWFVPEEPRMRGW